MINGSGHKNYKMTAIRKNTRIVSYSGNNIYTNNSTALKEYHSSIYKKAIKYLIKSKSGLPIYERVFSSYGEY